MTLQFANVPHSCFEPVACTCFAWLCRHPLWALSAAFNRMLSACTPAALFGAIQVSGGASKSMASSSGSSSSSSFPGSSSSSSSSSSSYSPSPSPPPPPSSSGSSGSSSSQKVSCTACQTPLANTADYANVILTGTIILRVGQAWPASFWECSPLPPPRHVRGIRRFAQFRAHRDIVVAGQVSAFEGPPQGSPASGSSPCVSAYAGANSGSSTDCGGHASSSTSTSPPTPWWDSPPPPSPYSPGAGVLP